MNKIRYIYIKTKLLTMSESKFKFPTEVSDLPSKGILYPKDNPLSSGKIEMKYMTAREEDILTNQNYIKNGTVIDELLKALIVSKINYNDLITGDKNAIMLAARVLGYGKNYQFTYDGEEQSCDLTSLEPVDIDFSKFPHGKNQFEYKLPNSERDITFKLLTGADENEIDKEIKALEKISKEQGFELTTRLKYMITSVDGKSEPSYINNFVETEFLSRDSLAFRKKIQEITPDIQLKQEVEIGGEVVEVDIPLTTEFFWPKSI